MHPRLRVTTLVGPTALANLAPATALLVPKHAHSIADLQIGDAGAQLDHVTGRLVPSDERRLQRKHAVVHVQIGSAHAGSADPNHDLTRRGSHVRNVTNLPRRIELGNDGCSHDFLRNV